MIYVDPLFDTTPYTRPGTPRCFRNTLSCHMFSDLPGEEGTRELVAFAKRIGLKPEWIQHRGSFLEHFDLVERRRTAAVALGAREVDRREGAAIATAKRDGSEREWPPLSLRESRPTPSIPAPRPLGTALREKGRRRSKGRTR